MKPVQASSSSTDSTSTLEPISSNNNIESSKPLEKSVNHKKESLDLDCKSSNTTEQTTEGRFMTILIITRKSKIDFHYLS